MKSKIKVARIHVPDGMEYNRSSYPNEGLFIYKGVGQQPGYSNLAIVTGAVCSFCVTDAWVEAHVEEQKEESGPSQPVGHMITESTFLKALAIVTNKPCEVVKF